jgi:hypothetical protein
MSGCEEWPVAWPCQTAGVDPVLLDAAQSLAGQLLWALSGYRIGRCTYRESFRPALTGDCGYPYKDVHGNWQNNGHRGGECCRVLLSHRPVDTITEVIDAGAIVDPVDYSLEGSWLRRRGQCWTTSLPCNDPELIVTYQSGVGFPPGTASAVGEVACEYLSALQGDPCRLPSRATSITRQGVTVTLDTSDAFIKRGRIGLPVTDAWLETVVGIGPRVPSQVYSPDLPRGTRA